MSDEKGATHARKAETKAAPKAKVKSDKPENMTQEEFEALREDVRRMWSPEPDETR